MCELCNAENITNSELFRPSIEKNDYIFCDKEGWFLNVYCDCGDYTPTPIKYCPMCGRKLGEQDA